MLLPARARGVDEPLRALVVHRDSTERDYVAAALLGWGHTVVAAESADRGPRRGWRRAGSTWRSIDDALIAAEPAAWSRIAGVERPPRGGHPDDGRDGIRGDRPSL